MIQLILQPRQIEQLEVITDFRGKSLLKSLSCGPLLLILLEEIQMGQHSHHIRETVTLNHNY